MRNVTMKDSRLDLVMQEAGMVMDSNYPMPARDVARTCRQLSRDVISMAGTLSFAIECELATIERLEMVKRTPKRELARHRKIAEDLILSYQGFHEAWKLVPSNCPRLAERLT